MSRKVFISFLGTNHYIHCNYFDEGDFSNKIDSVQYVQEAIYSLHLKDFTESDKVFIFLTEGAKKQNWLSNGQYNPQTKTYDLENEGLEERFKALNPKCEIVPITSIPEGYTSDEIWEIFRVVLDLFEDNDQVFFDITHGFRSLPMLGITLIQYATTIKKIEMRDIYYGAFEKLGYAAEVKKMPIEERNAPILNLASFVELQKWTLGAEFLLKSGNPRFLKEVLQKNKLGNLADHMIHFSNEIATCRFQNIIKGDEAAIINNILHQFSNQIDDIKPLKPIIGKIESYYSSYSKEKIMNGLVAVKYCIDMNLIQQGYTLLSEFLTSYVCYKIDEDYIDKTNRDTVNGILSIGNPESFTFSRDPEKKIVQQRIVDKVLKLPYFKKLKERNRSINANNRDDINHGGMRDNPMEATRLEEELQEKYLKLLRVIEQIDKHDNIK